MASNVDRMRAAHEEFNRRDFDAVVARFADRCTYTDVARDLTLKSPAEFRDWLGEWTSAFSDAAVTDAEYIDGGDWVIARFIGRGTNDGSLGPLPATGHRMSLHFCEVVHFDESGRIDRAENYYDQMTMLVQLGHAQAPPGA